MARRGPYHPQHPSADRSVRGYCRSCRLAAAHLGGAKDQSAIDGKYRQERRVGGPGATYLMAPFTHVSPDRPTRFSDGSYGVLYAGNSFEVALLETIHHHSRFMARTNEAPGWTSQFREVVMDINARLHDLRADEGRFSKAADPNDYSASQTLGGQLRAAGSNGVAYSSVRRESGECAGLFYPDLASNAIQGRHLDYHWDGERVDLYRDTRTGEVFRIV